MRSVIVSIFTSVFLLFAAGCASTVIPEEVLQLPEYTPVYTAHNLWCVLEKDKKDGKKYTIDVYNTQKGKVLPFGTEIVFLKSDTDGIRFKKPDEPDVYTLKYDLSKNLISVEQHIKNTFTTDKEEVITAGIRPVILEKLRRGLVEKGMRRNEVLLGYGPPPPIRTPNQAVDTWTYWSDFGMTKKIVFFDNKIIEIIDIK